MTEKEIGLNILFRLNFDEHFLLRHFDTKCVI